MTKTTLLLFLLLTQTFSFFGKPQWLKEMPNDPCYFYGRATVDISDNIDDARKRARNVALSDIVSQIKTTISSETKVFTNETNGVVNNDFRETIISWVEDIELTGFEKAFPDYKKGKTLSVIYKLSRKYYYNTLYGKWKNSKKDVLALYLSGKKSQEASRIAEWILALTKYAPFRGKETSYIVCGKEEYINNKIKIEGKTEALDFFIANKLREESVNIKLTPLQNSYSVVTSKPNNLLIKVSAVYNSKPIEALALNIKIDGKGWSVVSDAITNSSGVATFKVLKAGLSGKRDIKVTLANSPSDSILKFYNLTLPSCRFTIFREPPKVYLDILEENCGKSSNVYIDILKNEICNSGGVILVDKADANIIINGTVVAKKAGHQMGLCRANVLVDFNIVPSAGTAVTFSDCKVKVLMRYSFEKAGAKALKQGAKRHGVVVLEKLLGCL